jgi:hypothetical protein
MGSSSPGPGGPTSSTPSLPASPASPVGLGHRWLTAGGRNTEVREAFTKTIHRLTALTGGLDDAYRGRRHC